MDAETVVAVVQEQSAVEGAEAVARVAAVGDSIIADEVVAVGDALEDHAELSEERHDEILEGEQWLRAQLELLLTTNQSLQAQLTALQTTVIAGMSNLESILKLLQVSNPSIPQPPTPPVEVIAVVEPESGGEGPLEAVADEKPPRRRRVI